MEMWGESQSADMQNREGQKQIGVHLLHVLGSSLLFLGVQEDRSAPVVQGGQEGRGMGSVVPLAERAGQWERESGKGVVLSRLKCQPRSS